MRLIVATAVALLALAAPAAAEVRTLAEVHTPDRDGFTAFPVIDAFEGRVVWSDYDASIDAWRLTEHVGGVTRALPVAPRETPFDVDLGPDGRGGTLAAYSRCSRGLVRDLPTPQESRRRVRETAATSTPTRSPPAPRLRSPGPTRPPTSTGPRSGGRGSRSSAPIRTVASATGRRCPTSTSERAPATALRAACARPRR